MEKTSVNFKEEILKEFEKQAIKLIKGARPQLCNKIDIAGFGDKNDNRCKTRLVFLSEFYPHVSVIASVLLGHGHTIWLRDLLLSYFPLKEFPVKDTFISNMTIKKEE